MNRGARAGAGLLAAILCGCATQVPVQKISQAPLATDRDLALHLEGQDLALFQGVADYDKAGLGGQRSMLYGPGLIGFAVGLATHAAVSEGVRSHQKSDLQKQADRVLEPLKPVLDSFYQQVLIEAGLQHDPASPRAHLVPFDAARKDLMLLESTPVFSVTQDGSAIILDHLVSIHAAGATRPAYQNSIRVVSAPRTESDAMAWWRAGNGEHLRAESTALFQRSLDMALRDAAGGTGASTSPYTTFRYLEGHEEKMERAQVVATECGRTEIKTLRSWLMSVPVAAAGHCAEPAVVEPVAAAPAAPTGTAEAAPAH